MNVYKVYIERERKRERGRKQGEIERCRDGGRSETRPERKR